MELVIIESPLAGNFERNIQYAKLCMLDCLQKGEAPFASHLLYTQCLNDENAEDRALGIAAGFEWAISARKRVFYLDFGVSDGMQKAKEEAKKLNQEIEERKLPNELIDKMNQIGYNATKGFK